MMICGTSADTQSGGVLGLHSVCFDRSALHSIQRMIAAFGLRSHEVVGDVVGALRIVALTSEGQMTEQGRHSIAVYPAQPGMAVRPMLSLYA